MHENIPAFAFPIFVALSLIAEMLNFVFPRPVLNSIFFFLMQNLTKY